MLRLILFFWALVLPALGTAQEANVGFGTMQADPGAPVEVTADELTVSQADGSAVFVGDVIVIQGEMRLAAPEVTVVYAEETGDIARMEASGGVTLVSGAEAAESDRADYDVASGIVIMTGNVLLTQGRSALTSDRMEVDLTSNTARMTGRVQTVLFQGEGPSSESQ